MLLKDVLKKVKVMGIKGNSEINILHLSQKVGECLSGSLFFCIKGISGDGHQFAEIAVKNGAIALVVEHYINCDVTQILVKNTRNIMPKICNNFYSNILSKLKLIGVTGTNGKTTTTKILQSILVQSGKSVGVIGTNGIEFANKKIQSNLTTPDTIELFKIFNKMAEAHVEYVVMEVSAHAISLNKIRGLKYEVGIFTNLTQDHLDFFGNMHEYAITKLKFLQKFYCKNVVINIDDKYGRLFEKLTKSNLYTYGISCPAQSFAFDINLKLDSSTFLGSIIDSPIQITSQLPCLFNIYNMLGACVAAKIIGCDMDSMALGIKNLKLVDGRMNFFKLKNGSSSVIDFAHTPDGLKKVLESLKCLTEVNRIITVFGCGGDRDKLKRPIMGEVVSKLSDLTIVTSDNPRNEDALKIIDDISKGVKGNFIQIIDRKEAIKKAYELSNSNDLILIAGKGAENYQEINGIKIPYSDLEEIKKYI